MKESRLALALEGPGALPPAGTLLVIGPRAETDLSALPKDRARLVQGFRPDHDALAAQGYAVAPVIAGQHTAAVVCLPRARAQGRAWIAAAVAHLPEGAPVWIDGQKTDGVDSMLRDLRRRVAVSDPLSKSHGKVFGFAAPPPAVLADWALSDLHPVPGFLTRPGVFSAEAVDRGSALLAAALPADLHGRGADLGAGWGWLAAQVLTRPAVKSLDLVEADHTALDCARANVPDVRAAFHWADATRFTPDRTLDFVVMNPPFHVARAGDPGLGVAFIAAAARMLSPAGILWMVANRHLPYEAALHATFKDVEEVGGDGGFKLLRASHPLAGRKAAHAAPVAPRRGMARRAR